MTDQRRDDATPIQSAAEVIDRLAVELDGVRQRAVEKAVEYARGGVVFAAREDARMSFKLRPEIVAAALNTPDTAPSERGAEWVTLAPSASDSFSLDRATAWFEMAWRIAGEAATPHGPLH